MIAWKPITVAAFTDTRGGHSRTKPLLLKNAKGQLQISTIMRCHSGGRIELFAGTFNPTHFIDPDEILSLETTGE